MAERSELTIQGLFRSRARIRCPAVHIIAIPNGAKRGQKALNRAMREGLDRLNEIGIPATVSRDPDHALEFLRQVGAPFVDAGPRS